MADTILLKDIPATIMNAIDDEQRDYKKNHSVKLNQSKAVIKMLRDYIRCKTQNKFKPDAE